MDSQRQQASERIKQANNILVTVSSNPSVDQLAACIGLTVSLNKMGKHATAVFSGEVPSTLEFLQPEKTIEKNTDSLRDFIIALDKSKADKLRYKVEDRVVKIFITPYRTSITNKDLEFSQGDFNVDVVVALGVHNQNELDLAITTHGRILHDATIVTLNTQAGGELGSINWLDPNASSLSELGVELVNSLDKSLIDGQVATAFLTGIVAETERFSNGKTSPQTMSVSAQLMSSGANQQLVATKLEEPVTPPLLPAAAAPIATQEAQEKSAAPEVVKKSSDGTLEIAHDETKTAAEENTTEDLQIESKNAKAYDEQLPAASNQASTLPEPKKEALADEDPDDKKPVFPPSPQIHIDEHGSLSPVADSGVNDEDLLPPVTHEEPVISHHNEPPKMILDPPTLGGSLTASGNPGVYDPAVNESAGLPGMPKEEGGLPSSMDEDMPSVGPTIMPPHGDDDRNAPGTSFLGDQPLLENDMSPKPIDAPPETDKTLIDIERDVHSSHLDQAAQPTANIPSFTPAMEPTMPAPQPSSGINVVPPRASPAANPFNDPITAAFSNNDPGNILPPPQDTATPASLSVDASPGFADTSVPNMPVPDNRTMPSPSSPPGDINLDEARNAVEQARSGGTTPLDPIQALNAQPLGTPGGGQQASFTAAPAPAFSAQSGLPAADPNAPPSAPPPMMPPMPSAR